MIKWMLYLCALVIFSSNLSIQATTVKSDLKKDIEVEEVIEVKLVNSYNSFVSLTDISEYLDGEIKIEDDSLTIYLFIIDDFEITINLKVGYARVNNQLEPLLLQTSNINEDVVKMIYTYPLSIEDEIYVPLEFVERILNFTSNDENLIREELVFILDSFSQNILVEKDETNQGIDLKTDENVGHSNPKTSTDSKPGSPPDEDQTPN